MFEGGLWNERIRKFIDDKLIRLYIGYRPKYIWWVQHKIKIGDIFMNEFKPFKVSENELKVAREKRLAKENCGTDEEYAKHMLEEMHIMDYKNYKEAWELLKEKIKAIKNENISSNNKNTPIEICAKDTISRVSSFFERLMDDIEIIKNIK